MIVACATDNGVNFIDRHFGDALKYEIYQISEKDSIYLKSIINTSKEEDHDDPRKANNIIDLLLKENVEVGLTKVFGPNIEKLKLRLVPILISTNNIEEGLVKIREHFNDVSNAILLKDDRKYLDFRKK